MSITSEINRINTNISNAYIQAENKGATIPENQNSSNLADTIQSIPRASLSNGLCFSNTTNNNFNWLSQASTCTTLSNYSAFRNAGWTTGY